MQRTFSNALAPGTIKNRRFQASLYIKFMLLYNFNIMNPSALALAMYSQFLANSYKAPGTVKNHLSGVRAWLSLHNGSTTNFFSPEVGLMTKSIIEKSDHTPSPAPAITAEDVRTICLYQDKNPHPPAIKAAVLLAFTTFMRVSNVLSPNIHSWGGRHAYTQSSGHSLFPFRPESCDTVNQNKERS